MFHSKLEVFHQLAPGSGMIENSEVQAFRLPSGGGKNLGPSGGKFGTYEFHHTNKHLVRLLLFTDGWVVEFGAWTDGVSGAENYKCYINPLTGSRLYSKEAVVCYLEAHKLYNPTLNQGGSNNANPADFCSSSQKENTSMNRHKQVFCQIDYSPSGLPSGWIKEVRITKTKTSQKIRRDAYYIDTDTGYGFRSHKDIDRYVKNKDDSRIAFKLYKSHLPKACSIAKETLHPVAVRRPKVKKTAVRRHLFSRQIQKSNVRTVAEISDPLQRPSMPSADYASIECDDIAMENCSTPAKFEQLGEDAKSETESQAMPHFNIEGFPRYPANNMEVEGDKISFKCDLEQQGMLNGRGPQVEQVTEEQQVAPCMELPFVDSWPAYVIELAFKTLTRDDPVFEDIAAEYVQHHLRLVQNALPTGQPALVPPDGKSIKDDSIKDDGGSSSLD